MAPPLSKRSALGSGWRADVLCLSLEIRTAHGDGGPSQAGVRCAVEQGLRGGPATPQRRSSAVTQLLALRTSRALLLSPRSTGSARPCACPPTPSKPGRPTQNGAAAAPGPGPPALTSSSSLRSSSSTGTIAQAAARSSAPPWSCGSVQARAAPQHRCWPSLPVFAMTIHHQPITPSICYNLDGSAMLVVSVPFFVMSPWPVTTSVINSNQPAAPLRMWRTSRQGDAVASWSSYRSDART